MLFAPLTAAALVIAVATGPITEPTAVPALSPQQKRATGRLLVRAATECIARAVPTARRFVQREPRRLIAESMSSCVHQVGALIDAYERVSGHRSGEALFMVP